MRKILLFVVIGFFLTVGATAQQIPENLLSNGNFEEQGAWKMFTVGSLAVDDAEIVFGNEDYTPKYGKGNNLLVSWSGLSSFWELYIFQKVTLKVGTKYEFSGVFKDVAEGAEEFTKYWIQMVMRPVNGYEDLDEDGLQWPTYGINPSILQGMGHWRSYDNGGGIGQDTTFTFGSKLYEGLFTGKYHSNCNQGDTTIFTVPATYPTASGNLELGEDGDEVDFYFLMYFGESGEVNNDFAFTFDEFSIHEYDPEYDPYTLTGAIINQDNTSDSFALYPNPVEGKLKVNNTNGINSVSIFNIVGEEIIKVENIQQNMTTINTSDLNKGIYLVRVIDGKGKASSKKIVKQ